MCCVMAASLGGCGRRGSLDLPPQAQADPALASPSILDEDQPDLIGAGPVQSPQQAVAERRKRRIILDPLLD
jgi:predicted small lipoprotein YifL